MKIFKLILCIGLIFFIMPYAVCQKKSKKHKLYKTWVHLSNEKNALKGYFYSAKDSSIVILLTENSSHKEIKVSEIDKIKLRRKNKIGKSAGLGAAAGLVMGVAIGYIDGDDEGGFISFSAEEKAAGSAILLIPLGAGIGAGIGSIKHVIHINGSLDNYKEQKHALYKYTMLTD